MVERWVFLALVAALIGVAAWVAFPTRSAVAKRRQQFAEQSGAYVDPFFADRFDRDTRHLFRWRAAGLLACTFLQLAVSSAYDVDPFLLVSPAAAVALVVLAALRLRAAGREFVVTGHGSAVARSRRVVLVDYVSPSLLASAVVAALGLAALASVVAVNWHRGEVDGLIAVLGALDAAVVVGMTGFAAWFGHALCERPSPAVDASHLYLQDAWRARALSTAFGTVCVASYYAVLVLMFPADLWPGFYNLVLFLGFAAMISVFVQQPRWFRRRLWRELAPGQVLYPEVAA